MTVPSGTLSPYSSSQEESKEIALKNNSAELKKVQFVYKTTSNTGAEKARIELWGMK